MYVQVVWCSVLPTGFHPAMMHLQIILPSPASIPREYDMDDTWLMYIQYSSGNAHFQIFPQLLYFL